jgi:hypothetical protein
MPYYILKPAVDTPETGSTYPQVQKMAPGYDYEANNSVYALSREVEKLPDYEPNLDYFIVHSKARLSDILSVATIYGGFLISEKLKTVLEQFKLPTHKFYPARLQYKKQFYNYYWMHIICNLTDYVDYPNSTFFVYHNFSKNLGYINIASKDELIQKEENLKELNPGKTVAIWAERIVLSASFNRKLDLFKISNFDSRYYISESLQQAVVEAKITGCSITEATHLFI